MSESTYQLIDSGNFRKLEQVGSYTIVRPSPQAVWRPRLDARRWEQVDAEYVRFSGGNGEWRIKNKRLPKSWNIRVGEVPFQIEATDFGHLGIFPEQAANWARLTQYCQVMSKQNPAIQVLNLFGYTGGSSLACAIGGAKVTHVDASKTSVAWAAENMRLLGREFPIRWIVDDVRKFVQRELRRNSKYHGIILDPPSYGRGAKNEIWKIEDHLCDLMAELAQLLDPQCGFMLLSAHSDGYSPVALRNILSSTLSGFKGTYQEQEMLIPETQSDRFLPSGAHCWFVAEHLKL